MPEKRGRPRVQPDCAKIRRYAAMMWSVKDIAAEVGVGERTLFRNFGSELEAGRRKWRGTLRQRLIRQIHQGNFFALKFMLCQPEHRGGLGWTEEQSITHEHHGQVAVSVEALQQAIAAATPAVPLSHSPTNGTGNGHALGDD